MTRYFGGAFLILAALGSSGGAEAVIVRHDYDTFGTVNYSRYTNLANQIRFDTVGNVDLYTSVPVPGSIFSFTNDCTGTLISASIVLTAAHCFSNGAGRVTSFQQSASLSAMPIQSGRQVFFSGGPNLSTDTRYPTANVSYAVQFDSLSIHPDFDLHAGRDISFGPDLALLRVFGAPWIGSLPTNYIPLNSSTTEASSFPNFGITIGYGDQGNGRTGGTQPNDALEKRAGLTEVDYDLIHPSTLKSTFYSPGDFAALTFPSNFLQAAPGRGDSGGPLVLNLGSGDSIVGVVQGGGSFYDSTNWWTRVSSFVSWLQNESVVLGSAPVASVPGATISTPLLPNFTVPITSFIEEKVFRFGAGAGLAVFLDPAGSETVEIYVDRGPSIQSILLPNGFGSLADLWLWDMMAENFFDSGLDVFAGTWFDFTNPVSRFKLVGLDGDLSSLTLGFIFADGGIVDLRWRSIQVSDGGGGTDVPEPGTLIVLVAGVAALLFRKELCATRS